MPENHSKANAGPVKLHEANIPSSQHRRQTSLSSTQESSSLFALDLQTSTGRKKSNKPRPTLPRLNIATPSKVYFGLGTSSTSTNVCGSPTSELSTSGETEEKSMLKYHTECNSQLSAHMFEDLDESVNPFASQSHTTPRRRVRFNLEIPHNPPQGLFRSDDRPRRQHPVPAPIDTFSAFFDSEETSRSNDFAFQSTSADLIELFPKVPTTMVDHGAGPWGSNGNGFTSSSLPRSSAHTHATSTPIPTLYRPGIQLHHAGRGRSGVPASTSTFFPTPDYTPPSKCDEPPRLESGSMDKVIKDKQKASSSSLSSMSFSFPFNIPGLSRSKTTGGMSMSRNSKGKNVQRRSVGFNPPDASSDSVTPPIPGFPLTPPTELPAFLPALDLAFLPTTPISYEPRNSRHMSRYVRDEDIQDLFDDFDEFHEERDVPDSPGERRRKMSAGSLLAETLDAGQTPAFFGLGKSPLYPEQQSPALGELRTAPQPSSPTLHETPNSRTSRQRPLSARVYHAPFTFPSEQDLPFSPLKSRTMAPPSLIAPPSGPTERSASSSSMSRSTRSTRFRPIEVSSSTPPERTASSSSLSEPSQSSRSRSTSVSDITPFPDRSARRSERTVPERPAIPILDTIPRVALPSSSSSAQRRSEPTFTPLRLSTPVTRSSSSVSHMRNRRTFPRIPPFPLPGKSPLSLFSTSPGTNESLLDPQLPQHGLFNRSASPTRSTWPTRRISYTRPISPNRRSTSPTRPSSPSRPHSILDRGRPRSYQPMGTSPPMRPIVIRQPRRVISLRRERSSRDRGSSREEEKELMPVSPISGLSLLQALSSSPPAPRQAGGSTQRARPVTAPYPSSYSLSLSTRSYDALVDSTFAFQPLEPLLSFATAVPGVRASTPPEIFQGTQTREWSTTGPGTSSSSSDMSLAARWRRTFSPTRAFPSEVRSLAPRRKTKGKGKADREQDAPSSSSGTGSSSSVLGKQIAKLGQFFSKSKGKKDKEEDKEDDRGKDKGKEDTDKDGKEGRQRPASTPVAFSFQCAAAHPYRDSQEVEDDDEEDDGNDDDEEESCDTQPGPSGTGDEMEGNRSGSSGTDDKIEMLVEENDLKQIDTPIARRFL
ncbi:hypothetical protein BGZ82_003809 [Podila clonocystis]|nr:hypothetical protein BGZ82_003809 [Podila clonocystis]